MSTGSDPACPLRAFREALHTCTWRRADALFESSATPPSRRAACIHLPALAAFLHRRGWDSLYAALSRGSVGEEALRDLLTRYPLAESMNEAEPRVYAVDQKRTAPPRRRDQSEARLLLPSRRFTGQPIVAAWAYGLVVEIGFERDSRGAPMDARRVPPEEDANDDAASEQIRALVGRLLRLGFGGREAPLFVSNGGDEETVSVLNEPGVYREIFRA